MSTVQVACIVLLALVATAASHHGQNVTAQVYALWWGDSPEGYFEGGQIYLTLVGKSGQNQVNASLEERRLNKEANWTIGFSSNFGIEKTDSIVVSWRSDFYGAAASMALNVNRIILSENSNKNRRMYCPPADYYMLFQEDAVRFSPGKC